MTKEYVDNTILVENAHLIFKNFSGEEGQYNRKGDRNFAVILDRDTALSLLDDGWNVRRFKETEENEDPEYYISVAVSFGIRPPKIVLITMSGKTIIGEDQVEMLDWVDMKVVDLIIRPYNWVMADGRHGVKAYLQTLYVTLNEDELDLKYA